MAIPITQRAKSPAKNALIAAAGRMYEDKGKPPNPKIELPPEPEKTQGPDMTKEPEKTKLADTTGDTEGGETTPASTTPAATTAT